MIPAERQDLILTWLAQQEVVSIAELTERLAVSHMTVRRDIQALEQGGRVTSVSGGVRLSRRLDHELPHLQKAQIRADEKKAVGRAAAGLVSDGMVVYLDAGTTTLEIARGIATRAELTVVTNDFVICTWLSAHADCRLFHSGGLVERDNQSCVGPAAAEALARFNYDIAFISTSSWTATGLSSPSEAKGPVKAAVLRQAQRAVLVSDSSKYGLVAPLNILPMTLFDTVVTDSGIGVEAVAALCEGGAEVILVDRIGAEEKEEVL